MSKRCTKCKETKELSMFSKRQRSKDGHCNECKECRSRRAKAYNQSEHGKSVTSAYRRNPANKEKAKQYKKEYYSDPLKLSILNEQKRQYHIKNIDNPSYREKLKARQSVKYAVYKGLIKKKSCLACDSKKNLQLHHGDYSQPYNVICLCSSCHSKLHKGGL